jgi:YD repeat-containing protein
MPEKGFSGNGSVYYSEYDVMGRAGRKKEDGHSDIRYGYDRAGRLTGVRDVKYSSYFKRYTYGDETSTDWGNGKLRSALL